MIGHYLKPDAVFPPAGLGRGMTQDDKIIYAIKKCVEYYITIAVLDEVAAMDGACPLELLADCSGIAWGGTAYQMVRDLSHFKVLLTAGRGLTPAQQAWPPLTLEAYAQLEMKRSQRRVLGELASINWTDHANVKRLVTLEVIDVKHLRWIAELSLIHI